MEDIKLYNMISISSLVTSIIFMILSCIFQICFNGNESLAKLGGKNTTTQGNEFVPLSSAIIPLLREPSISDHSEGYNSHNPFVPMPQQGLPLLKTVSTPQGKHYSRHSREPAQLQRFCHTDVQRLTTK